MGALATLSFALVALRVVEMTHENARRPQPRGEVEPHRVGTEAATADIVALLCAVILTSTCLVALIAVMAAGPVEAGVLLLAADSSSHASWGAFFAFDGAGARGGRGRGGGWGRPRARSSDRWLR